MCEVRDKVRAFAEYVENYAERNNMTTDDVLKLALFRLEGIEYVPTKEKKDAES